MINKSSLEQDLFLKNIDKLTCLYGPMYLQLNDYPPYYDKQSDIFETNINNNLRYCFGYPIYSWQTQLITGVSKTTWKIFYSEFPQNTILKKCSRKISVIIVNRNIFQVIHCILVKRLNNTRILGFHVHFSKKLSF